ncbi:MAG: choice-of-anchor D domain-containing protein [Bacteroidota bacterium]|nr:choice-of-anchor D domain-containing protein [Bacteroidota bacterium]
MSLNLYSSLGLLNKRIPFLLLLFVLFAANISQAQIAGYIFQTDSTTYSPVVPDSIYGTTSNDEQVFNNLDLGFSFTYAGTAYTKVSIASNGFIGMGATVTSSSSPISSSYLNLISPLGGDLQGQTGSEIGTKLLGTAPNRVYVIQWKNYRYYGSANVGDTLNFQIRLYETSNKIEFVYGNNVKSTTSKTPQVGLKGISSTDYNNRTTTTNWGLTTAGSTISSTCTLSSTVKPVNLRFTFSIPTDPVYSITPTSSSFGTLVVGQTSPYTAFTVKNTGVGTLTINSSSITGTDNSQFVKLDSNTYPISLTAGQSAKVYVKFAPTLVGTKSASLTVAHSLTGSPSNSALSGTAYAPYTTINENFDTVTTTLPVGWTGQFTVFGTGGTDNSKRLSRNIYSTAHIGYGAFLPFFSATADSKLKFDYRVVNYTSYPLTPTPDSLVKIYIKASTDFGATFTIIDSITKPNHVASLSYANKMYNLSAFSGKTIQIKLESGYVSGDYYVDFDNVFVGALITPMTWCNLQWPATATTTQGDTLTVYTQGWKDGLTPDPGPGAGISVWIGVSPTNTNPNTWTSWTPATFNVQAGNNDEFMGKIGYALAPGTYYYASRWQVSGSAFTYGAYSAGGGNFWDSTNYVSGVLTVNPLVVSSYPYSQSFDGTLFPPVGFSNPEGLWSRGTETHSGLGSAKVTYSHTGTANLITPQFNLPANHAVSFWWKDDDISKIAGHDTTFCEISTDGGTSWSTLGFLAAASQMSNYSNVVYDLSAYAGTNVHLRWRDVTDALTAAYGTGVDDIILAPKVNAPSNLNAISNLPKKVQINWTNNATNQTGFVLERKLGDSLSTSSFAYRDSIPGNLTAYVDTLVADTTLYTYRVYAYNANLRSSYSNVKTVLTVIPVELVTLTANTDKNTLMLNWSTATEKNNKGFQIETRNTTSKKNNGWNTSGFIQGKGTTTERQSYSFTQKNLPVGTYQVRIKQIDFDGSYAYYSLSNEVKIEAPAVFSLDQNFPNPFNPSTKIRYTLPYTSNVKVTIYNTLGQMVKELVNQVQDANYYELQFDASNLSSGVYIYTIHASSIDGKNNFNTTKKMMLVK